MHRYVRGFSAFLSAFVAFVATPVFAQGLNVEVSPGKINRIINPGESYTQTFRIGNYSGADQTFYLYARDFTVGTEDGAPSFADAGEENDKYTLTRWITVPQDKITVPANQVRTVDVTITVPDNAEVGGHYGAFFVQTEDPVAMEEQEGSVIGSIGRIASLLLITVPGDIVEDVTLESFATDEKIYWTTSPTVDVIANIKNNGNVHTIPTGAAFVSGGIGYKTQSVVFNQEQGAALPGAPVRRIVDKLEMRKVSLIPPMGKFEVDLVVRYGLQGSQLSGTTTFYVVPIKFLAAIFAGAFVVIFILHRAMISFQRRG